jgi:dolichyl-phosphate-mannose--protein O-mannosyl transferase
VLLDRNGIRIDASRLRCDEWAKALLDEQDAAPERATCLNSAYYDESYHAGTALENIENIYPYEISHPPLAKLILSLGIRLLGMTPLGWRLMGTLTGVLMVPAMYVFLKKLFGGVDVPYCLTTVFAFDFMHFVQTRIATIDSFAVLFIILCFFFMLRFLQRDIVAEPLKKVLPDLALSGFFMGCAVASKWIGVYAGLGLAVLYFWHCARHLLLGRGAKKALAARELSPEDRARLKLRADTAPRRILVLCLWCLLFFVAVPAGIYLLSYIPYFRYAHTSSPGEWLKLVLNAQEGMFSYHSKPGLGMDHLFYSPWYEWPLIVRPMYYAMAYYLPQGWSMAIFCFGNPAVWYVGLAGLAFTLCQWALGHRYSLAGRDWPLHLRRRDWDVSAAFVLLGLLAQFLPWMLVPRGTYIYHYFA